ncbi:hypothetical protein [Spiroplasma tabanidicola]|uniref:Uncharacterized protein n=1 Tax=Spiroplasma tabanidicola TaxID=324079 RepID=A0A6I6C5F9_9MOLU|nr:hypothetical protein [Spiroplasma tabanidicola]QGS52087.1 hypothetical protein STABA_v1c07310 [Spiroplasma tabanidicola]
MKSAMASKVDKKRLVWAINKKNSITLMTLSIIFIILCIYQDFKLLTYDGFIDILDDFNIKDNNNNQVVIEAGLNDANVFNIFKIGAAIYIMYFYSKYSYKLFKEKTKEQNEKLKVGLIALNFIVILDNLILIISNICLFIFLSSQAFDYNKSSKVFELVGYAKDFWKYENNIPILNLSAFAVICTILSITTILFNSLCSIVLSSIFFDLIAKKAKKINMDIVRRMKKNDPKDKELELIPLKPIISITPDLKNHKFNIIDDYKFWSYDSLTNQTNRYEYIQKQIDKNKIKVKNFLFNLDSKFDKKEIEIKIHDLTVKFKNVVFNFNEMDFIKQFGDIKSKKLILLAQLYATVKYKAYSLQVLNDYFEFLNASRIEISEKTKNDLIKGFEKSLTKYVDDFKHNLFNGLKNEEELTDAMIDIGAEAYYEFCNVIVELKK